MESKVPTYFSTHRTGCCPQEYIRLTKYHTYHFSGPPKRSPMMMMMMRQLFRVSWMQELTVPSASFLPRPLFVRLSTCQASAPAKMVMMLSIISSISLSLSNILFSNFSSSKLHHFDRVSNQCYRIESENKSLLHLFAIPLTKVLHHLVLGAEMKP